MTVAIFDTAPPLETDACRRASWLRWLPSALFAVAAIARQATTWLDCDVSWLLTVGERVLDGQRLYTDIIETNPPASVLLYLPGIALARATGTTPEFMTAGLVFLLGIAAILGSARLLSRAGMLPGHSHPFVVAAAAACFLLLPGYCFAQREHIALLLVLPIMAVCALRMEGHSVRPTIAIFAGIAAGLTMAIKPHFALAIGPMILLATRPYRSVAAWCRVETVAAALVVLIYGAVVLTCFPHFGADMMPMLRAAYLPSRAALPRLLATGWFILTAASLLLALAIAPRRATRTTLGLPLLASAGFAVAALIQGKGYINHGYPALALALFGLALVFADGRRNVPGRKIGVFLGIVFFGVSCRMLLETPDYSQLVALVRKAGPPHPRMLTVGGDLAVSFPVVRWVGGNWVERQHSLWITANAPAIHPTDPAKRAELARYVALDERMFVADVTRGRPDIVLIQGDEGLRWIASHPAVAAVLSHYRHVDRIGDVIVWAA